MGLDQYLHAEKYEAGLWKHMADTPDRQRVLAILELVGLTPDDVKAGGLTVSTVVCYWRKANQIHSWFVREVQGGNDDCGRYYVGEDQLRELRDQCQLVLDAKLVGAGDGARAVAEEQLPTQSGFFFGDTEYDEWYFADLEDTVSQLDGVLNNPKLADWSFYYQSSW